MKRFLLIGAIFGGTMLFSSCEDFWSDCIEGNNRPMEERRAIPSFDRFQSTGNFDVYLKRGDSTSFRITAEQNIIPRIKSRVIGNTLYLDVENNLCLRNNQPIRIFLTTPSLKAARLTGSGIIQCDTVREASFEIENTGSGDMEVEHLQTDGLEARILGSGDIELKGTAEESRMEIWGSGNILALDLLQSLCDARILGSGSMYIHVTDQLDARILGSGNIYYRGQPNLSTQITGSGNVIRYR